MVATVMFLTGITHDLAEAAVTAHSMLGMLARRCGCVSAYGKEDDYDDMRRACALCSVELAICSWETPKDHKHYCACCKKAQRALGKDMRLVRHVPLEKLAVVTDYIAALLRMHTNSKLRAIGRQYIKQFEQQVGTVTGSMGAHASRSDTG